MGGCPSLEPMVGEALLLSSVSAPCPPWLMPLSLQRLFQDLSQITGFYRVFQIPSSLLLYMEQGKQKKHLILFQPSPVHS